MLSAALTIQPQRMNLPTIGPISNLSQPTTKSKGLARYEFIKQLGDGTFGDVHLCRTKDTNEMVAIKT